MPRRRCNDTRVATSFSGRLQGEDRDLGWAVETEGNTYRADAAIDIKLHVVEAEETFGVFFTHRRKHKRAHEGQPNLAAVGVAREHDIDEMAAWMPQNNVSVVGLMSHQNYRAVGLRRDGEVEAWVGRAGVVDSREPEAGAVALDREVLIDQHRDAI